MAAKKKATPATEPPAEPKKKRAPRERMSLQFTVDQTARFEAMAGDYGLKVRAARVRAEELIGPLLDSLEGVFEEERKAQAQMEIRDLEELLEKKRAALSGSDPQEPDHASLEAE